MRTKPWRPSASTLARLAMAAAGSVFDVAAALAARGARVQRHLEEFLSGSSAELSQAAEMICTTMRDGRTVFACGNGGSAAQAAHMEAELLVRFRRDRGPLPCLYLGTSAPTATAIANDYSADSVFSRPLTGLGREGDLLVALSTSGSSPNVLSALEAARSSGISSVLLTGPRKTAVADVVLCFGGESADEVQDGHQLVIHALMDAVEASVSP